MTDDATGQIRIREQTYTFPRADTLTAREWHLVKEIAGVRSAELAPALMAGDTDVLVAFAHIALRRAGATRPSLDDLWDLNPNTELELLGADDEPAELEEDPTTAGAGAPDAGANGSSAMTPASPGSPSTVTS